MKILLTTQDTTPTCVYIQAFFDQYSTCIRMSGLPYRLMNTLPHRQGTKTDDYVRRANERMVEQIRKVNETRRPFTVLTQGKSPSNWDVRPATNNRSSPTNRYSTLLLVTVDHAYMQNGSQKSTEYTLMDSASCRGAVLLLLLMVLRIRTSVLTFSRSL
jgi:hypothetical protein